MIDIGRALLFKPEERWEILDWTLSLKGSAGPAARYIAATHFALKADGQRRQSSYWADDDLMKFCSKSIARTYDNFSAHLNVQLARFCA